MYERNLFIAMKNIHFINTHSSIIHLPMGGGTRRAVLSREDDNRTARL